MTEALLPVQCKSYTLEGLTLGLVHRHSETGADRELVSLKLDDGPTLPLTVF
jgi:hypothetical protein